MPTSFPVTVISQKELFERAAGDKNDPRLSSRSLLALMDGSIGFGSADSRTVDSFGRNLDDARVTWSTETRSSVLMANDLAQLPGLRQQAATLQGQVDAFSSPEVKQRLSRIEQRRNEAAKLAEFRQHVLDVGSDVGNVAAQFQDPVTEKFTAGEPFISRILCVAGVARC